MFAHLQKTPEFFNAHSTSCLCSGPQAPRILSWPGSRWFSCLMSRRCSTWLYVVALVSCHKSQLVSLTACLLEQGKSKPPILQGPLWEQTALGLNSLSSSSLLLCTVEWPEGWTSCLPPSSGHPCVTCWTLIQRLRIVLKGLVSRMSPAECLRTG